MDTNLSYTIQNINGIKLNIISWCNVIPTPQYLDVQQHYTDDFLLNNIPSISTVINTDTKKYNYDNLTSIEWFKSSSNIYTMNSNNLVIDGNVECSQMLINNSNILDYSSNLSINKLNIVTNGLKDSNNTYIIFTSNGYLTLPQELNCDIIMVGAGGNGGNPEINNDYYNNNQIYELPPIGTTFYRNNGTLYTPYKDVLNSFIVNAAYKTELFIVNFNVGTGIYDVYYTSLDNGIVGSNLFQTFIKDISSSGTSNNLYDGGTTSDFTGMYKGSRFLELNTKGEWVYIKSVLPFIANRILILSSLSSIFTLAVGILYGSNDGSNWTLLYEMDKELGDFNNSFFNNTTAYIYYGFLIKKSETIGNATNIAFQELLLFGYFLQNNSICNNLSGGGGSGEVIFLPNYKLTAGNYNITVGKSSFYSSNRQTIISSNNNIIKTAKGGGDGELLLYLNKDTNNLKINQDSIIKFNNESNINLNTGIYNANFLLKTGNIDFINTSNLDKSYPVLKDNSDNNITPILWYKFDNPLNIGLETNNSNLYSLYTCNIAPNNYNIYSSECVKGNYSYQSHGEIIYLENDIQLNINNINWSISLWVFIERGYGYYNEPFFMWGSSQTNYNSLYAGYNTSRNIFITNVKTFIYSTSVYNDSYNWIHIVFTFNSYTKIIRIYRNGLEVGYGIFDGQLNTNGVFRIGSWLNNNSILKGKIDDFRVYNGIVLSSSQILELYKGRVQIFPNFTSNGLINPVAWYKFNSNNLTADSSGNSYSLINNGFVIADPIEQSSVIFNGSNYFENNSLIFSPNEFTIVVWVKLVYNNNINTIASCRNTADNSGWTIYINNSNLEILTVNPFVYYNNFIDTNTAIWKHLVVSFKTIGINQVNIKCYVNGIFINSNNDNYYQNTNTNLRIGAGTNETTASLYISSNSLIDDFKFYNFELNQNQINQLYNNSSYIYSNCDLFTESCNLYTISSNTLVTVNYNNNLILTPQDYYIKFANGSIGFNYPTIRNYPIIPNLDPILWYKFENSNSFLTDTISNKNLWNSNTIYRDFNSEIIPDLWYKFNNSNNIGLNTGILSGYNLYTNEYYFIYTSNNTLVLPKDVIIDILLVGAGGRGGINNYGGGGGAGEVIYYPSLFLKEGIYNIDVGIDSLNSNNRISSLRQGSSNIILANGGGDGGSYLTNIQRYPSKAYDTLGAVTTTTLNGQSCFRRDITLTTTGITYGSGTYETYISSRFDTSGNYDGDKAFNYISNATSGQMAAGQSRYATTTGNYTGSGYLVESNYLGEWFCIKMPYPIAITSYKIYQINDSGFARNRSPANFKLYASFNGADWIILQTITNATYISYVYTNTDLVNNISPYYYYAIVANKLTGGTSSTFLHINEWEINGREISISKPMSGGSGGGGGYEILNISNIQNIEKRFPPKLYNSASSTISTTFNGRNCFRRDIILNKSGITYGDGTYEIYFSSQFDTSGTRDPILLFNYSLPSANPECHFQSSQYNNTSPFAYNRTNYLVESDYLGDWVCIKMPIPIAITSYSFYQRTDSAARSPKNFKLYASVDGVTWVTLQTITNATYTNFIYTNTSLSNNTTLYTYYAIVVNQLIGVGGSGTLLNFIEWVINGKLLYETGALIGVPYDVNYSKLTNGNSSIITSNIYQNDATFVTSNTLIYNFNNEMPFNFNASTYNLTFNTGIITLSNTITSTSIIDNSYPIIIDKDINSNIEPDAWYKFDNGGNIGLDSKGTYNFVNNGTIIPTTGLKGSLCAVFNGTNQYLSGTGVDINSKSFSICCWSYPTILDTTLRIIYSFNGSSIDTNQHLHFGYRNSSIFTFAFWNDDLNVNTTTADLNVWTHWAGVYNHNDKTQIIYKNGVNIGSRTINGLNGIIAPTNTYNIGRGVGSTNYFAGRIDDLRIYANKALNLNEINEIYKGRFTYYNIIGGDGGSALTTGRYNEIITGSNIQIGKGGTGATFNSTPAIKNNYGDGGDGNGGSGYQGLAIIKFKQYSDLIKIKNQYSSNYYITYNSNSTLSITSNIIVDILCVGAGGRGGVGSFSGGGDAGEVIYYPSLLLTSGTYNINIGIDSLDSNNRVSKLTSNNIDIISAKGGGDGGSNLDIERRYPSKAFDSSSDTIESTVLNGRNCFKQNIVLNDTNITYGIGTYEVYYSSYSIYTKPIFLFNYTTPNAGPSPHWGLNQYNNSTGIYIGTNYLVESNYLGDWVCIKMVVPIAITSYSLYQATSVVERSPKNFKLYASIDGVTWITLQTITNATYTNYIYTNTSLSNNTTLYTYYAIVVNQMSGTGHHLLTFDEWVINGRQVYGTIERGENGDSALITGRYNEPISGLSVGGGGIGATLSSVPTVKSNYGDGGDGNSGLGYQGIIVIIFKEYSNLINTYSLNYIPANSNLISTYNYIKGSNSLYFDNFSSNYLQVITNTKNIDIIQNLNFSISFWHYPLNNSQSSNIIFAYGAQNTNDNKDFYIVYDFSSSIAKMRFDTYNNSIIVYANDNYEFLNKWTFWCYTYNTNSKEQYVYVNGRIRQSEIATTNQVYLNIGRYTNTTAINANNYYLNDFRFYRNRIFTIDDVKNLYLNNHIDKSYPSIKENYFSIKGTGSLYLNSLSSNYALIPSEINFNNISLTNGISFAFWVYINSTTPNNGTIIYFGTSSKFMSIGRNGLNSQLIFKIGGGNEQENEYIFTATVDIIMNQWSHITWTISSKDNWKIYINSSLAWDKIPSTLNNYAGYSIIQEINNNNNYFIGKDLSNNYFDGNITDFRIYDRVILIDEVFELFNGNIIIYNNKKNENDNLNNGGNAGFISLTNNDLNQSTYTDGVNRYYSKGTDGEDNIYIENITGSNLNLGKGGIGANYYNYFSNINPSYGDGGHGAGYMGGNGLVIIKIPNYIWNDANVKWQQIKNINTNTPLSVDKTNTINLNYNSEHLYENNCNSLDFLNIFSNITLDNINNINDINSNTNNLLNRYLNYTSGFNYVYRKFPSNGFNISSTLEAETNEILNGRKCIFQSFEVTTNTYDKGIYYIYYSSSIYNTNLITAKSIFDNNFSSFGAVFAYNQYDSITGFYISKYNNYIKSDYKGEWVILKLEYKIILKKYIINVSSFNVAPAEWKLYGSNDGNNFEEIDSIKIDQSYYFNNKYEKTINNNKYYKYYGFTFNRLIISPFISNNYLQILEIELFDHYYTDMNINNTNQNEYLNGYNNNPSLIRKFPSLPYSSATTTRTATTEILGGRSCYKETFVVGTNTQNTYDSGTYTLYYSTFNNTIASLNPVLLFDGNLIEPLGGAHFQNNAYNANDGYYLVTLNNYINNDYKGDWIILKLPYPIILREYVFYTRSSFNNRAPGEFKLYGSIDGNTFIELDNKIITQNDYVNNKYKAYISNTNYYQFYGITVNRLATPVNSGSFVLNFVEIEFYDYYNYNNYVGIDIENPQALLHLANKNSNQNICINFDGIVSIGKNNNNDTIITNVNNNDIIIGTSNIERFKIKNSGYVGIGITNPSSLCQINDFISVSDFNYERTTILASTNTNSYGLYFQNLYLNNYNLDNNYLTYNNDQYNGDSFTINKTGIYSININMSTTNTSNIFWIDKNSMVSATSSNIYGSNILAITNRNSTQTQSNYNLSYIGLLNKDDIIRIKSNPKINFTIDSQATLIIDFIMGAI